MAREIYNCDFYRRYYNWYTLSLYFSMISGVMQPIQPTFAMSA